MRSFFSLCDNRSAIAATAAAFAGGEVPGMQDDRGITAGCGAGNYRPANPVTRDQMAIFLAKTFVFILYQGTRKSCVSLRGWRAPPALPPRYARHEVVRAVFVPKCREAEPAASAKTKVVVTTAELIGRSH